MDEKFHGHSDDIFLSEYLLITREQTLAFGMK